MRNFLLVLVAIVATALPVSAQVAIPNTFIAQTRIQSALVNENFSELGAKSCNRVGCTMTGTFTSLNLLPSVTDTYAIGSLAVRYSNVYSVLGNFSDQVTVSGGIGVAGTGAFATNATIGTSLTIGTTLGVTGDTTLTGALNANGAVDIAAGITAGSGNVAIVDGTGKIPALSSTYLADVSGTNLTGVAKLGSANTYTARNDFKDYSESVGTPAIAGGAITFDISTATHFSVALNAAITSVTFSGVQASKAQSLVIYFTNDGTVRAVTWPASVKWSGGVAPTFTGTNTKVDVVTLLTRDGGTTWFGFFNLNY